MRYRSKTLRPNTIVAMAELEELHEMIGEAKRIARPSWTVNEMNLHDGILKQAAVKLRRMKATTLHSRSIRAGR